eukprot:403363963
MIQKDSKMESSFKKIFKGQVSIIKNYLVLKNSKFPDIGSSKQDGNLSIQWLDIQLWEMIVNDACDFNGYNFEIKLSSKSHSSIPSKNAVRPATLNSLAPGDQSSKHVYMPVQNNRISLLFKNLDQKESFQFMLKKVCIIEYPLIKSAYTYVKRIGNGGQATVDLYHAINAPEDLFAVKIFKRSPNESLKDIFREINFLREFEICNNIVQLHEVYKTKDKLFLVMNFAKNGPLLEHLQKNPNLQEKDIRMIMEQLLLALDFMHKKQIIHRDIKPDNILVMDKINLQVCIADLGFACSFSEEDILKKKCGTPGYVGPEVLKGAKASPKSDIFGLGSLFYNLLAGQMLFGGKTAKQVLYNNQMLDAQVIVDRDNLKVSKESLSLLKQMIHKDPSKRPTAEECLNHQWFQEDSEALQFSIQLNNLASHSKVKNSIIYDKILQEPEFQSFIMAPNYYNPQQNLSSKIFPQLDNSSGESSMKNRKEIGGTPNRRNFKICYSKALRDFRDKSPCSAGVPYKKNFGSNGSNYNFGDAFIGDQKKIQTANYPSSEKDSPKRSYSAAPNKEKSTFFKKRPADQQDPNKDSSKAVMLKLIQESSSFKEESKYVANIGSERYKNDIQKPSYFLDNVGQIAKNKIVIDIGTLGNEKSKQQAKIEKELQKQDEESEIRIPLNQIEDIQDEQLEQLKFIHKQKQQNKLKKSKNKGDSSQNSKIIIKQVEYKLSNQQSSDLQLDFEDVDEHPQRNLTNIYSQLSLAIDSKLFQRANINDIATNHSKILGLKNKRLNIHDVREINIRK